MRSNYDRANTRIKMCAIFQILIVLNQRKMRILVNEYFDQFHKYHEYSYVFSQLSQVFGLSDECYQSNYRNARALDTRSESSILV